MSKKKKIPNLFYKQSVYKTFIINNIQYDFTTNYFCNLKYKNNILNEKSLIFHNKMLKIHDFRYKS